MRITVPAGDYWLGDPCYAFDKSWQDICDKTNCFETPLLQLNNGLVLGFPTMYGDGEYHDQFDNTYGVDAGLIGLVTAGIEDRLPNWMYLIRFDKPTECSDEDGVLTFGKYRIDTTFSEEES